MNAVKELQNFRIEAEKKVKELGYKATPKTLVNILAKCQNAATFAESSEFAANRFSKAMKQAQDFIAELQPKEYKTTTDDSQIYDEERVTKIAILRHERAQKVAEMNARIVELNAQVKAEQETLNRAWETLPVTARELVQAKIKQLAK